MKCKDCCYYWKDEDDAFPQCHYNGVEDWAPCNEDHYYKELEDYEDEDEFEMF